MATSELSSGYREHMAANGPSKSYERILGSQHGIACDIFGAWKKDPKGELERAMLLGGN